MSQTDIGWEPRLASLVATLVDAGHLHTREWIEAFADTPRHLFAPQVLLNTLDGYRQIFGNNPSDHDEWLSVVYSDDSLVTQDKPHAAGHRLPSGQPLRVPTSSSTKPSLMACMLEAVDIGDGMRVLEIGTGTGYNAALLAHRLGSASVVSIDIDPGLVHRAQQQLAGLGHRPTLVVGDGAAGAGEHGPYDRIIVTAAVPEIPFAWIEQLTQGGQILANLRGDLSGDTLCLLTKHDADDEVIGPILPIGGNFMWLRPDVDDPHRPHEHAPAPRRGTTSRTTTQLNPADIRTDDNGFRFLQQLQLHGARSLHREQRSTRAPAATATPSSSPITRTHALKHSHIPSPTAPIGSSSPGHTESGTPSRPPTDSSTTSTSPPPTSSASSPTTPPSSCGSTTTTTGIAGPYRSSDNPPVEDGTRPAPSCGCRHEYTTRYATATDSPPSSAWKMPNLGAPTLGLPITSTLADLLANGATE